MTSGVGAARSAKVDTTVLISWWRLIWHLYNILLERYWAGIVGMYESQSKNRRWERDIKVNGNQGGVVHLWVYSRRSDYLSEYWSHWSDFSTTGKCFGRSMSLNQMDINLIEVSCWYDHLRFHENNASVHGHISSENWTFGLGVKRWSSREVSLKLSNEVFFSLSKSAEDKNRWKQPPDRLSPPGTVVFLCLVGMMMSVLVFESSHQFKPSCYFYCTKDCSLS
jgi:hypothetical protein